MSHPDFGVKVSRSYDSQHHRAVAEGDLPVRNFRLVDMRRNRPLADFEAQKQIQVTRFGWSAVVAFAGVGSVRGGVVVSEWLAERVNAIPADSDLQSLVEVLLSADEWLRRVPLDKRSHTFSVGAFVGADPLFAVVSNFESTYRMPTPAMAAGWPITCGA